jgi:hypothetical protein
VLSDKIPKKGYKTIIAIDAQLVTKAQIMVKSSSSEY